MCRNIKPLFNFDPPASEDEIRDAALQFVRKISGYKKPSMINEAVFLKAVDEISMICEQLLSTLVTTAAPKNREEEALKARQKAAIRFPKS